MKTAEAIGIQALATLRDQAASNRQAADALRSQIRVALGRCTDPSRATARDVRKRLGVVPPPSLRTVQQHLKKLRAEPTPEDAEA